MSKELEARVRNELFKRKMTQKELAEMLGISQVYLSDILRGRRDGTKPKEYIKQIKEILAL